ncbi:MAG: PEP-CTERM sorting domain-containing protein [Fimbriimonadaceae bacterium]|nr:PEP-CTERM sorting domain-containing protein [Fimbriimonadaceae bacterium]
MYWKGWTILFLAGFAGTVHAVSITGLYGTGVNNNGTALGDTATDGHYTLVDSPVNGAARTPLTGYFPLNGPYWLPDQGTSRWIAPGSTINGDAPAGLYVYRTKFMIEGLGSGGGPLNNGPNPETLDGYRFRLWGRWASDDIGIGVYLNGSYIGGTNEAERPWATWASFDTGFTGQMFKAGENTLEFRVQNAVFAGRNPTGIQAQVHGAFQAVPEPASLSAIAAGGLLLLRRRKRSK